MEKCLPQVTTNLSLYIPHLDNLILPNFCNLIHVNCVFTISYIYLTTTPPTMRIPYIADPPPVSDPEHQAIVDRIRARRSPRPLQSLDLALLHSPAVADGWNTFLGAIRTKTSLPDDIRELAISRVAVCNEAWYEWKHHAPLAVKGGVSEEALEVVKRDVLAGEARPEALLNERQWAVLLYTDEMTRNVHVSDDTFALLKSFFSDQEVAEVTATVRHWAFRALNLLRPALTWNT